MQLLKQILLFAVIVVSVKASSLVWIKSNELEADITKEKLLSDIHNITHEITKLSAEWKAKGCDDLAKQLDVYLTKLSGIQHNVEKADPKTVDGQVVIESMSIAFDSLITEIKETVIIGNRQIGKNNKQIVKQFAYNLFSYNRSLTDFINKLKRYEDNVLEKINSTKLNQLIDLAKKDTQIIESIVKNWTTITDFGTAYYQIGSLSPTKAELVDLLNKDIVTTSKYVTEWRGKGYEELAKKITVIDTKLKSMLSSVEKADPKTPDGQVLIEGMAVARERVQQDYIKLITEGNQEIGKNNRQLVGKLSDTVDNYRKVAEILSNKIQSIDDIIVSKLDTSVLRVLQQQSIDNNKDIQTMSRDW
ncbi:uncharacterized protein LOC128952189 isoform X2 [Oppia nitens]|uniref:uncharacterized protein LOC128952189 isoform X2 n=1 Tax=Oppia nitens TaxID=1686743 RepID=UPI0023DAAAA5|nr:uncharacterized protein LOC128952189 isoform X2 [Oppia nitens]